MDQKAYDTLDKQIWRTKGARFNAYRRYSARQSLSNFTLAVLAVWNLALEVLPASIVVGSHGNLVSPMSILVSVFLLVVSLLEASKGYEVKADRLHLNAIALSEVYGKLQETKTDADLAEVRKQYHSLIRSCPENHSPQDDQLFQMEHSSEFPKTKPAKTWIIINAFFRQYWFFAALLILPLLPLVI